MKHYLTFKDEKSDKFWQIEVSGNSFTVTYGKTGASGTSQTKTFDTAEQCIKEAEKLFKEKVKKGYVEGGQTKQTGEQSDSHLDIWQGIVSAKDIKTALRNHFSFLAETPRTEQLLKAVLDEVTRVTSDANGLKLTFEELELLAAPPAKSISNKYPKSFQNILRKHNTITISEYSITLGEHKEFDLADGWFDDVDEDDEELYVFAKAKTILCPISEGTSGNFWIYHPKEKNQFGEPLICYLEHDGMIIKDPQEGNAGDIFVDSIAKVLNIIIQSSAKTNDYPKDPEAWWNALGHAWQTVLEDALFPRMEAGFSVEKIKKIKSLDRISISKDAILPDLNPLLSLTNLKSLRIYTANIKSYEAISEIAKLKELEIDKGIYKLEIFSNLLNLEKLVLRGDHIVSLNELSKLTKLKELRIDSSNFISIEVVANYPKLEGLYIAQTKVSDISVLTKALNLTHVDLPSTVTTLNPIKDLRKLYYVNTRSCKISLEEMVDFITHRRDGFKLLTYNNEELLHRTFKQKLQGLENKVAVWTSRWIKQKVGERSGLILLALYYFLKERNKFLKNSNDLESDKEVIEKKLTRISSDNLNFVYNELVYSMSEKRVAEAKALLTTILKVTETNPDVRVTDKNGQRIELSLDMLDDLMK